MIKNTHYLFENHTHLITETTLTFLPLLPLITRLDYFYELSRKNTEMNKIGTKKTVKEKGHDINKIS